METGYNVIVGADAQHIAAAIRDYDLRRRTDDVYGNGYAADIIAEKIMQYLEDKIWEEAKKISIGMEMKDPVNTGFFLYIIKSK